MVEWLDRVDILGIALGLLFVVSALLPLGSYHFEGQAEIVGRLWNLMLPTGWFDGAIGAALLLHRRIGLKRNELPYLLLIGGVGSVALFYLQKVDVFLGLWHGVQGDYDVEGVMLLTAFPFLVGMTSILTGLHLRTSPYQGNA